MWAVALVTSALVGACLGDLSLSGARCGQLSCQVNEYCSEETSRCSPCADICDAKHHNYDAGLCVKNCQDYIHELRFVSRTDRGGVGGANGEDLRSIQAQARAALIVSSILLALAVCGCLVQCYRFTRRNKNKLTWSYIKKKFHFSKSRVKQYPTDLTHHNPHAETAKSPKRDLKLEVRTGSEPAPPPRRAHDVDSGPKTVSTCVSSRHPAEDTTLDYSYDNMALNVTPPPASAAVQHF